MTRAFGYGLRPGDFVPALALGVWLLLCAHILALLSRIGACGLQLDGIASLWQSAHTPVVHCTPVSVLGGGLIIGPEFRDGALLGLMPGQFAGTFGQLYGLGLLAMATSLTIFFLRWDRQSCDDGHVLVLIWTGTLLDAGPRLVADGVSEVPLRLGGLGFGISDLALVTGVGWALWRIVAEYRGG